MSLTLVLALALQQPAAGPDSMPQPGYWQQEVAYEITARLDEPRGVLEGVQAIRYVNRSPDTLTTFALHLYLNAFRPASRWADADSAEGRRRFNDLADPDYAFNHVRNVRIMGQAVEPEYPFAPDSTVVRFRLPRPLAPGEAMPVTMDWDARPSTVPRRQGRQGRRFDFAQWYPKVVVYDRLGWQEHPLYPAGEFYGEFGSFRVTLDVPEDQVVGATGVPLCGDPGWERARRGGAPVDYGRGRYAGIAVPEETCAPAGPGRKTIVWHAEDVHHFALSLNPDYRYEGGRYPHGRFGDVLVHVLYQPGDEQTWGDGKAVQRTETALAWLDRLYGPFAWPQVTNVHRIEGGGTEFPMMMHNGSADQGLIVHELGHNYTMGILANNEWREGWLDEGFTSFQTSWFWEAQGRPTSYYANEAGMLMLDLDGYSEPTSLVSDAYRDFATYNTMIYARGELFFHQLRYVVGDETMHRILRTFYERWQLKHVDEGAFRSVAEDVCRCDLSTLFGQFLHTTALYDYGLGKVRRTRLPDGRWRTRVEVRRHEPGRIPVEVAVLSDRDTAVVRAEGLAEREWVELTTAGRPGRVLLDPRVRTHDWNMLNNRKEFGFPVLRTLFPHPDTKFYFHPYLATRSERDRLTVGIHPTVWYNDAGGLTLGLRTRDDYLGRYEQNVTLVARGTGWANEAGEEDVEKTDLYLRVRNPVWLRADNLSQTFEGFRLEGRHGARVAVDWTRRSHLNFGATRTFGARLDWVRVEDPAYLDPGFYERGGTVELALTPGVATRTAGGWQVGVKADLGGGVSYGRPVAPENGTSSRTELYSRTTLEATARGGLGAGFGLGVRFFAGAASDAQSVLKQREIYLAGADPHAVLMNPFLRSRGALLVQDDVHYHAPGGVGVRALDPRLSAAWGVGGTVELERGLLSRPRGGLFNRIALAAFGDAGLTDFTTSASQDVDFLADVGIGLRADHRIGQTRFTTRFDVPFFVSRPELARQAQDDKTGWRWTFSFQPAL